MTITVQRLASMFALASGCAAPSYVWDNGGESSERVSWTLRADEDLALTDRRCTGEACPAYPNPLECEVLRVNVRSNGRVCGECTANGRTEDVCGGMSAGIPYRCFAGAAVNGRGCLVCEDIDGRHVVQDCAGQRAKVGFDLPGQYDEFGRFGGAPGAEPPPSGGDVPPPSSAPPTCYDARTPGGDPCSLCMDASRAIVSNTCVGDGTGTVAPSGEGTSGPGGDVGIGDGCPADAAQMGRAKFAEALNRVLVEAGIPLDFDVSAPADVAGGAASMLERSVRGGWVETGGGVCTSGADAIAMSIARNVDRRGAGWFRDGRPRCSLMVRSAIADSCGSPVSSCSAYERGVSQAGTEALNRLQQQENCIGSPIVLDLDGDGVATADTGAHFDFLGVGARSATAWIRRGDALLATDRDGDGVISGGAELFGDLSPSRRGALAADGFEALAAFDDDRDGDVDADDARFDALVAWSDDGDGRSEPGELTRLGSAGVARIHLESVRASAVDDAGSVLSLWGRFERAGGGFGTAVDVFFAD